MKSKTLVESLRIPLSLGFLSLLSGCSLTVPLLVFSGNGEDVYNKAIEKGLIDPSKDFLSEKEKTELIFKPGFSTADNVTEISGRGVGMDVVLTNIQSLGGRIEIETKLGEGTTFSLIIPSL